MALTKFGFIVTGDNFEQLQGTSKFQMKVVGVNTPEQGIVVAKQMVSEGIQLIELCGGFSPVWAGKIIEAINYAVPVGVVAYGPESIDSMHKLFSQKRAVHQELTMGAQLSNSPTALPANSLTGFSTGRLPASLAAAC